MMFSFGRSFHNTFIQVQIMKMNKETFQENENISLQVQLINIS